MAYYILESYRLKVHSFQILQILKNEKNCFFLDSSLYGKNSGRYSFLGFQPFDVITSKASDPFPALREKLSLYRFSLPGCAIPFLGGAVGYLSYDLGLGLEKKIKKIEKEDLGLPDCLFYFYNTVIIIDHRERRLSVLSVGLPERKYHLAKALCKSNSRKVQAVLSAADFSKAKNKKDNSQSGSLRLGSNLDKRQYLEAVKKAKEYIGRGDIYQINLSQRFESDIQADSVDIYKRLRRLSPSYFSAYFDAGNFQLLSSSPERFLRLDRDNTVTTRPMKGTRPRSPDKLEDKRLMLSLLASSKDKAELVMIVDLERNDLGRVCDYGSIRVKNLRQMEKYKTVLQTTATVEGKLHKDKNRIDLLRACFPGGSISGCPKIRAMEIIEELEPTRRFIYTGSFGYLSFSGTMDFNILIRTILKKENKIYFGVGGGIVADSDPEDEYQETLIKAKAMIEAIHR